MTQSVEAQAKKNHGLNDFVLQYLKYRGCIHGTDQHLLELVDPVAYITQFVPCSSVVDSTHGEVPMY